MIDTKTINIDHLKNLRHKNKTIIGWSVNSSEINQKEEVSTATLKERINAARKCSQWGYPVAFHFDPVFHYKRWENDYSAILKLISEEITPNKIAYISIGTLRLNPSSIQNIIRKFNNSYITTAELFPSHDGKLRYLRPIRVNIYKHFQKQIKSLWQDQVPYYLCMEDNSVWEEAFNFSFTSNEELDSILYKNLV